VQADLDGPLGDAEPDRDRRLRQVLAIAQRQQLAVAPVQPQQGGLDVGPLDRVEDAVVLGPLEVFDRLAQVRPQPCAGAEGLVADDRRQPLVAPFGVAQGGAPAPGPQQGILGDVLGFAAIAGVAVGGPQADSLRLAPLPTVVVPSVLVDG
jgi:hypothetical protein